MIKHDEGRCFDSLNDIVYHELAECGEAPLTALQAPDSKVHGANMGPIWVRQDPNGPHVGPMNFAIWGALNAWE